MTEKYNWIVFHAHPTAFVREEDFHPDFFGTFVCPDSRPEPEQLLGELLENRKLSLVHLGGKHVKSKAEDWGMNERLKKEVEEQGYGMSLIKLHAAPIEGD